jgi:fructuronate reductase
VSGQQLAGTGAARPRPALARTRPPAPTRVVHLGLGNFFRAHQAWYTQHASDGADWGIAAYAGRGSALVPAMRAQDGLFTLVVRDGAGDAPEVVESVTSVHEATDHAAWLGHFRDPRVALATLTVTEAGYRATSPGESARAEVRELLRDPAAPVGSALGRVAAGLLARRAADAGPMAVVPCDNLPGNGGVLAARVRALGTDVDPAFGPWLDANVTFPATVVDRITPAATDDLVRDVARLTGVDDAAPVATEPFAEWFVAGGFPAGRPGWGASFVDDVTPYENRKLWMLNGAHSLLAYVGLARGCATVADTMGDDVCRELVELWWDEAQPHVALGDQVLAAYRRALVARFGNPRIRHELAQIAADGSEKVAARFLPVLRAERAAGRVPAASCAAVGAWIAFVRQAGGRVRDPRAGELGELTAGSLADAVDAVLDMLAPDLAADRMGTAARVLEEAGRYEALAAR